MGKRATRKACSVYLYLLAELAQANPKQAAKIRRKIRRHKCPKCKKLYQNQKRPG